MAEKHWKQVNNYNNGGGAVYGLGLIGALVYYFQHAAGFTDILWGIIKAILWPAFLIYNLLGFLGM